MYSNIFEHEAITSVPEELAPINLDTNLRDNHSLATIDRAKRAIFIACHKFSPGEESFKKLLYMMSNKLVNVDDWTLYDQLRKTVRPLVWRSIFSVKSLSVKGIAETLFPLALEFADAIAVQILLNEFKIDPDAAVGRFAQKPLELACTAGSPELVRILLEAGADVKSSDVLNCAIYGKCIPENGGKLLEVLLNAGANPNSDGFELPLTSAASLADLEAVSILLRRGADVNPILNPIDSTPPLSNALEYLGDDGDEKIICVIHRLLEAGANVHWKNKLLSKKGFEGEAMSEDEEYEDQTMLEHAFEAQRSPDIIDLLISYGAEYSENLIEIAFENDDLNLMSYCLRRGARLPSRLTSGLRPKSAKLLLEYEPWDSQSAFLYAAYSEDSKLIRLVLEAGARVTAQALKRVVEWVDASTVMEIMNIVSEDYKDEFHNIAMKKAIHQNDLDWVKMLQSSGVAFSLPRNLNVALLKAARNNDAPLINHFLHPKSQFRLETLHQTKGLLTEAVKHGSKDTIDLLLRICPLNTTEDGPHLLAAALLEGEMNLFQLLLEAGCCVNKLELFPTSYTRSGLHQIKISPT